MKGIDVLINNAGIGEFAKLEDVKISQFEKIFSTNVFGLTMLTQEVAKFFKTQQHGSIINIGSSAATAGFPSGSVYCASKFALRGLTECWRHELRRENIRVMLINPSEVTTAFNNKKRLERDNEPKKLTPDEIAHAIVSAIRMDDRGFIPELNVWATNPF
jgi:3-oxoacyl-[acyl-carrier protein] reductase